MKGKIKIGFVLLISVVFFILFTYYNCTKSPTRYQSRYMYLYAGDIGGYPPNNIYIISVEVDAVVDSISINGYPTIFSLSPDKRTIYLSYGEWDTANHISRTIECEIDTRTKKFKYIGPNTSTIVSPDGRYLFKTVGQPPSYEFQIFNAYTHKQVYAESTYFGTKWFDRKAPLVYGYTLSSDIKVFSYKLMRWVKTFYPHYPDGRKILSSDFVLSPDSRKVYFLSWSNNFFLGVFDIEKDSLIAAPSISYGGNLSITPDGKYVYITDPGEGGGCVLIGLPPSGEIAVFNTETNTVLPNISTEAFRDTVYHEPLPTIWMVITPDSKKGYVSTCRDRIVVLDLIRNEAINAIIWPSPRNLRMHYIAI